ncbi:MAG TPA: GGDEF domain-containing protein, partial [Synergistaceae bacterium]|nr:GGDEF domain-containing protein [Synergistaceae bacterium]
SSTPQKAFRGNVFFFDMDNFKEINDSFGHETGDALLQEFVSALQKRFPECPLFRYGGDEFLLLRQEGPGSPEKGEILEYLEGIKESQKKKPSNRPPLQFSTGHAAIPRDASSLQEAIALADSVMYREKKEQKESLRKTAVSFSG